jgi:hypothetical protein
LLSTPNPLPSWGWERPSLSRKDLNLAGVID